MNADLLLLSTYLDGELSQSEKLDLELRLDAEPSLRLLFENIQFQNRLILDSVHQIDGIPMSTELKTLFTDVSPIIQSDKGTKRQGFLSAVKNAFGNRQTLSWTAAFALTLGVIFTFSFSANKQESTEDMLLISGKSTPNALGNFLSQELTGATLPLTDGNVSQKMAFIDRSKSLCKYYVVSNDTQVYHAIACVDDNNWKNQFVLRENHSSEINSKDMFIPASGKLNTKLRQYLTNKILNEPLTKAEEALILKNYRH